MPFLKQLGRIYTKLIGVFIFRWQGFISGWPSFLAILLVYLSFLQWEFISLTIWKSRKIFLSWTKVRFSLLPKILLSPRPPRTAVPATWLGLFRHPSRRILLLLSHHCRQHHPSIPCEKWRQIHDSGAPQNSIEEPPVFFLIQFCLQFPPISVNDTTTYPAA